MESIGTLAGGIAHDLNNILAPIVMSIDLLKGMAEDPQTKSILDTIGMSANRGADIVRQVLSFARGMESEKIEVQPNHLLKELERIVKDTFPKDIRFQFSIPKDTWTILGDPAQVQQVLLNLCLNARDAMPNGGSLTVSIENSVLGEQSGVMNLQAKGGRYVTISVTDTGTGLPTNLVDKIFEPFFTTKTLQQGTGLGLSTSLAIVRSHEGIIQVDSRPGAGSTFKISFPAAERFVASHIERSERAGFPRGNGEMVLLIDDEASIRTVTGKMLQIYGYQVLTASNGEDAVALYSERKNDIAVVLTDTNMPRMDGPTAIRELMKINPKVKIIATSGLNANESKAKAAGAGVKHFLTKPYMAETLLTIIRTVLDEV
jgi:CheY-like chemotaxis protein